MSIKVDATYASGTLKLDRPVEIEEHAKVHVTIDLGGQPTSSDEPRDPKKAWAAAERFVGMFESVDPNEPVAAEHDRYLYK